MLEPYNTNAEGTIVPPPKIMQNNAINERTLDNTNKTTDVIFFRTILILFPHFKKQMFFAEANPFVVYHT